MARANYLGPADYFGAFLPVRDGLASIDDDPTAATGPAAEGHNTLAGEPGLGPAGVRRGQARRRGGRGAEAAA
jgi:hypothetical protein